MARCERNKYCFYDGVYYGKKVEMLGYDGGGGGGNIGSEDGKDNENGGDGGLVGDHLRFIDEDEEEEEKDDSGGRVRNDDDKKNGDEDYEDWDYYQTKNNNNNKIKTRLKNYEKEKDDEEEENEDDKPSAFLYGNKMADIRMKMKDALYLMGCLGDRGRLILSKIMDSLGEDGWMVGLVDEWVKDEWVDGLTEDGLVGDKGINERKKLFIKLKQYFELNACMFSVPIIMACVEEGIGG